MSRNPPLLLVKCLTFILFFFTAGFAVGLITRRVQVPYRGLDRSGNFFHPIPADPVAMRYSATTRYQLDDMNSASEFAHLLPSGGHTVRVDDEDGPARVYTVTLFHQLKCLDIIRQGYILPPLEDLPALAHHCLNYLHQTILCRPSLGIESTKNFRGGAVRSYETVCNDWSAVYDEAERNHASYSTRKRE